MTSLTLVLNKISKKCFLILFFFLLPPQVKPNKSICSSHTDGTVVECTSMLWWRVTNWALNNASWYAAECLGRHFFGALLKSSLINEKTNRAAVFLPYARTAQGLSFQALRIMEWYGFFVINWLSIFISHSKIHILNNYVTCSFKCESFAGTSLFLTGSDSRSLFFESKNV